MYLRGTFQTRLANGDVTQCEGENYKSERDTKVRLADRDNTI